MNASFHLSSLLRWSLGAGLLCHLTRGFVVSPVAITTSNHRRHIKHAAINSVPKDNGSGAHSTASDDLCANESDEMKSNTPPKPMSRLAMAAADWMEEEEEDELSDYWDRFDDAKSSANKYDKSQLTDSKEEDDAITMSTDQRLDNYLKSRGIDKTVERKYAQEIGQAMTLAASSSSAYDAIQTLERVRTYMQPGSKIGGSALLELAYAYHAHGDVEEAVRICNDIIELNSLREVRTKAKQLLADPERYGKNYDKKGFWSNFDSSWWR